MRIKLQIPLHLWHVSQSPMDVRCDPMRRNTLLRAMKKQNDGFFGLKNFIYSDWRPLLSFSFLLLRLVHMYETA